MGTTRYLLAKLSIAQTTVTEIDKKQNSGNHKNIAVKLKKRNINPDEDNKRSRLGIITKLFQDSSPKMAMQQRDLVSNDVYLAIHI